MTNELDTQHARAYEIAGVLIARGYAPTIEIGGGGILIVTAPLDGVNEYEHRISYSAYVDDALFVSVFDGADWVESWSLPVVELNDTEPTWHQTIDFLNELERELNNAEN